MGETSITREKPLQKLLQYYDDSDDESDEDLEDDCDPNGLYTDPDTGEKFTLDEFFNDPENDDMRAAMNKCHEPGHSCRQNYEKFVEINGHYLHALPKEKLPVNLVSREQWGAEPCVVEVEPTKKPFLKVVFTYNTGLEPCNTPEECVKAVRQLQSLHMNEYGLSDIAYNFVVGGDWRIYMGRGWHTQSDKALKYPQWRHRRLDVAFLAEKDHNDIPDLDLLSYALELMDVGCMKNQIHHNFDIYENKDPPKCLKIDPNHGVVIDLGRLKTKMAEYRKDP